MTDIEKLVKVAALDFYWKSLLGPKWGKWVNTFELFSKSIEQIFLKLYLMTGIKQRFKVQVLDF